MGPNAFPGRPTLCQVQTSMEVKPLKILQLGKFYPIYGGVEKVAYDLTVGLSGRHVDCDMLCSACRGGDR